VAFGARRSLERRRRWLPAHRALGGTE
jgi:hypothetical protein